MQRISIKQILNATDLANRKILAKGWVRTRRDAGEITFVELNDGSCLKNLQTVVNANTPAFALVKELSVGTAAAVSGTLVPSQGKGQKWDLVAEQIEILGKADENYPLQKKRHTDEFLRTIAHLRPRTNKYGAMLRIRSAAALAVHRFFAERDFCYVHTPILTGSDCEGAGEMFRVVTNLAHPDSFFGRPAALTVSGQLEGELLACALGKIYTFGPTFRAENSNTARHAAEFWMIEPEMAFADLVEDMDLAEEMVKDVCRRVRQTCFDDLELFAGFVDKDMLNTLSVVEDAQYERLSYTDAVNLLQEAKTKFEYIPKWGADLQSEHERFLCETYFKKPVMVYNYPKEIKAFYMRLNDDNRTVSAMDLLVPRIGELIGGSQREERLTVLEQRLQDFGLCADNYWWYLDSRRFGTNPHAGFGLGFERLLMLLTGISNIRDVTAFPRTPKNLEF